MVLDVEVTPFSDGQRMPLISLSEDKFVSDEEKLLQPVSEEEEWPSWGWMLRLRRGCDVELEKEVEESEVSEVEEEWPS